MILSPEIIDHILAFLYNNQRALAACSLVSSSWTDFARRRLFYTVKYVRGKWDESLYPSFLEFLESSPSIAQYVHVLSIEGERDQLYDYWGNLHPPTFAALLAALPNLEEVNIDGVSLHSTPEDGSFPEQHSSSVLPRSLKRVRFGKVTVDEENSCTTLLQFLCLISSIETLDIYQLSSDYEVTLSKVRNRRRMLDVLPNLGIRTLNISGGSATPGWVFLEAIRAAKPQTLRNLEYLYYEDEDNETDEFEGFQNFLDDVAGSLKNLTISLRGAQKESPILSWCSSLQNLKFNHDLSLRFKENIPLCINATLDALESTPQLPFKLTFELGYFYLGDVSDMIHVLSSLDWARLGRVVAWHPCRVNKLTIVCRGSATYTGFEDVFRLLQEKLRDLDSRGLLEISRRFA